MKFLFSFVNSLEVLQSNALGYIKSIMNSFYANHGNSPNYLHSHLSTKWCHWAKASPFTGCCLHLIVPYAGTKVFLCQCYILGPMLHMYMNSKQPYKGQGSTNNAAKK